MLLCGFYHTFSEWEWRCWWRIPTPLDASDRLFVGHEADVGQIYSFNDPEQPCMLHVSLRAAPQETV